VAVAGGIGKNAMREEDTIEALGVGIAVALGFRRTRAGNVRSGQATARPAGRNQARYRSNGSHARTRLSDTTVIRNDLMKHRILFLVCAVVSLWLASGTVHALVGSVKVECFGRCDLIKLSKVCDTFQPGSQPIAIACDNPATPGSGTPLPCDSGQCTPFTFLDRAAPVSAYCSDDTGNGAVVTCQSGATTVNATANGLEDEEEDSAVVREEPSPSGAAAPRSAAAVAAPVILSWNTLHAGDCQMDKATLTFYDSGWGYFSSTVKTYHTHTGDYWHIRFDIKNGPGYVLFREGQWTGPRMSDGNPPPEYLFNRWFTYDQSKLPFISWATAYYSC